MQYTQSERSKLQTEITSLKNTVNGNNFVNKHPSYGNVMYLGWSGSSIICRVDTTDFVICRASLSGTTLTITI